MATSCWKWTGQLGSAVQNKPTVNNVEEKGGGEFVTWEAGALVGWESLTFTLSLMDRLLSLECHHSFLSLECHHSYHSAPFLHQPGAPLCLCLDNLYSSTLRSLLAQSLIFCRCTSYKGLGNPSKTCLMVTAEWGHEMKYQIEQKGEWTTAVSRQRNGFGGYPPITNGKEKR